MQKQIFKDWKTRIKKFLLFFLNPHLLLCFGIGWMITNGWAYIAFGIGTYYSIPVLCTVSGAYLTALWFPFTPEKIVTAIIAIGLLRWLFPNDQKTLAVLHQYKEKAIAAVQRKKRKK